MGTTGLRVGGVPPALAEAISKKCGALALPTNAGRAILLAEHVSSVRAIVDAGQVPIDAELMGALPNRQGSRIDR